MSQTMTCERCGLTAWASTGRIRTETIETDDLSTVKDVRLCADCYSEVSA